MPECDCESCNCGCQSEKELCKTCGGTGQVPKKQVYLKLGNRPKETVGCPDCKGTGKALFKSICPGYLEEEECEDCKHKTEPVTLQLRFKSSDRAFGYLTEASLKNLIPEDGETIVGTFIPNCKFRQMIIRKNERDVVKFHLVRYEGHTILKHSQVF